MTVSADTNEPSVNDNGADRVRLGGGMLTLHAVERVANGAAVAFADESSIHDHLARSCAVVSEHLAEGRLVYGVNTAFGGMSNIAIPANQAKLLQLNALLHNRAGAGGELPERYVRAGMLLRLNSHLQGVSGVRWELTRRLATFLNEGVTPIVREFGSIGASGDLIPLSSIARAVTGVDPSTKVRHNGAVTTADAVLASLGLGPLVLEPKEGLAMVNGTSVSTGIAACCVLDAVRLMSVSLGFHALSMQGLGASREPFDPFIHRHKPHPGQVWTAEVLRCALLDGKLLDRAVEAGQLAQDRYSVRCLPQFLGPAVEAVQHIAGQIETEINSVTDNPLIDPENSRVIHGGNFLAEHVATALDTLRAQLALVTKHVDAQLALLFAPEFSNGLPPSLAGNPGMPTNLGLKALQVCGNSIMPLVTYYAPPLADRFPTHADQFNQNINSMSYGAAHLTCQQLRLAAMHLAVGLLCAMQAVELRGERLSGSYDPRDLLATATVPLYEELCRLLKREPTRDRPYCFDDGDRDFETDIETVADDLRSGCQLVTATADAFAVPLTSAVGDEELSWSR